MLQNHNQEIRINVQEIDDKMMHLNDLLHKQQVSTMEYWKTMQTSDGITLQERKNGITIFRNSIIQKNLPATVFIRAIHLMDIYYSQVPYAHLNPILKRQSLRCYSLYAIPAVLLDISAKFEGYTSVLFSFNLTFRALYQDLFDLEMSVLEALDFKASQPTAVEFISELLSLIYYDEDHEIIESSTLNIVLKMMVDQRNVGTAASVIALAAVLKTLQQNSRYRRKALEVGRDVCDIIDVWNVFDGEQ